MPEPPSLPTAFGIEAVHWLPEGADALTVRVQGRWRRRRPSQGGPALLVVESEGRRHRFPAMPEPPSLAGAAPGTWQMTFSVPAESAPHPGDSVWLQLGAVVVPVPLPLDLGAEGAGVPAQPGDDAGAPRPGPPVPRSDPPELAGSAGEFIAARRLRSAELALESARRRAAEAEAEAEALGGRIAELEGALLDAQATPARLEARLVERERSLRIAEQHAHAESRRRLELEEELGGLRRVVEEAGGEWPERADLEARIVELEDDLEALRRRAAEAEHALAAARARPVAPAAPARPNLIGERSHMATEARLADNAARGGGGDRPPQTPAAPVSIGDHRRLLAQERAQGTSGQRSLGRRRLPVEGAGSAAAPEPSALRLTLGELREELLALRAAVEHETAARAAAERRADELAAELTVERDRARRAFAAIAGLRAELAVLARAAGASPGAGAAGAPPRDVTSPPSPDTTSPPSPDPMSPRSPDPISPVAAESSPVTPLDPHRLADALVRLRSAVPGDPAPSPKPAPPRLSWLAPAFRSLLRGDPEGAGALLLGLLPLQGAVHSGPLSYDLVIGEAAVVRVEVADGAATVQRSSEPRPLGDVTFALRGSPSSTVRLLLSGPARRRLRLGVSRVRGNREAVAALRRLVAGEFTAAALSGVALPLSPALVLETVAAALRSTGMPDGAFLLGYAVPGADRPSAFLSVDGGRIQVGEGAGPDAPAPADGAAAVATLRTAPEWLLAAIVGGVDVAAEIDGDERALERVRAALARPAEQ